MNRTLYAVSTSTQMSTLSAPSNLSAPFTSGQLMMIVASISFLANGGSQPLFSFHSVSSVVFFLLVLVLLAALYRRDPHCCKARPYQEPQPYLDAPPQYYSNSQTLEGSSCNEHNFGMSREDSEAQQLSGQVFVIGLPSSYCLPSRGIPFPRLPSYESVRKKDRQRQIHMMIADRFGLNTPVLRELPPTYEESVRHSVALTWGSPEPAAVSLPPVTHRQPEMDHTSSTQCFTHRSIEESYSAFD
ncbi:uncharacterized protein LOC108936783 isoform X2 [Scleropages formosus]|uniref:uncharacterized protein LOC108936783 isoform X2 n=1 Tax=Scleropages formosus TaxID=113540 RepID=UPI000877FF27|nr:uncharacterized protein LOC108936783 isoform X2 [Scleropages formosus]